MAKTGLSYYQAETDRFQDIKVKRLKKRYGCEGYAVYQYIQNEIYRVEGCYIRFTDDQLFDVSEYWGIEEQRVEKIIEYCTEVELFDTITWHTNHVLTSVDIQQRSLEICRRAKKKIVLPEDIRLVEIQDAPSGMDSAPLPAPLPLFSGQEIETKTGEASRTDEYQIVGLIFQHGDIHCFIHIIAVLRDYILKIGHTIRNSFYCSHNFFRLFLLVFQTINYQR